ncbi:MAG: hypothetical protein VXW55_04605 [Candidatus Thermoplasmatota archaeon]|nr:hypothetical protein [Candidatus Thermoplasmatota archaeon]MEC8446328.1 hypothetical protein [Candidatus Thermoplasmatota archaeon]
MSNNTKNASYSITFLFFALSLSGCLDTDTNDENDKVGWIDPVVESENCENCTGLDKNHQHTNLMQHFLQTDNMTLIDYHNLNCDGNEKPPAELDNTAGRPCLPEFKNTAPTPGDNSEIAIEGNFLEDCEIINGKGGCYAYVSSYNQFEILDISEPNNIILLSTYYAEIARIIDIKVTQDNNWVLINHELTNSELDPIPNDDDANSGTNRLDLIDVSDKFHPVKRAEWNNPPAGFHNQDIHVYCSNDIPDWQTNDCEVFLFGADPYPEINGAGLYKGTQVFYAPDGLDSFIPGEGENESKEIVRWGGYSPDPSTTCGGTVFNHDHVIHKHPITNQILLYASYWDAGLRIVDVSSPPPVADPNGLVWPQDYEVGRWMGCPSDTSGWYGPDGGGHAGMTAEKWTSKLEGNGDIHYAVPYDHLICNGISKLVEESEWPASCGTGPEDPEFGINWRHYTLIAPEYGQNDNHTGYVRTIDTTDPSKPFLVSEWKLPGKGIRSDGSEHEHHFVPSGYIYSPHNGDTGNNGNVYWTHYHAGIWVTGHDNIWEGIVWKDGIVSPEQGWQAIDKLGTTETLGYYLAHGPDWLENAKEELGYDLADCWASCMIPFNWGLQYDPRGFIYISEMVSGIYVVQYDGDKDSRYDYPPLFSNELPNN